VRVEAGVAELVEGARVPTSLAGAIADRLGFLSPEALSMVRTAALLGTEFSLTELAVVAGRPAGGLVGLVEEAAAARVVEASGSLLRFRHPLIRQALYDGMPAAVRAALHRQAAQALAEAGAAAERVAQQALPIVDAADGWVLGWLAGAVPVTPHGPDPRLPHPRQARRPLPQRGRPRSDQAPQGGRAGLTQPA
jgi:hypothetical protein